MIATTACQTAGDLEQPVDSNPRAARQALARLAADGSAVPVIIRGDLAGLATAERNRLVTSALGDGVRGMDVRFEVLAAGRAPDERLVVELNPVRPGVGVGPCSADVPLLREPPPGTERILAAFCRGDEPLAMAAGTVTEAGERSRRRLLWRIAQTLFPDDYEDTYGFDVLPDWLGIGVGGSFGF